jgi:hypothetical protein
MRYSFILTLILGVFICVSAQEESSEALLLQQYQDGMNSLEAPKLNSPPIQKIFFGFRAGSSVILSTAQKPFFTNSLAPEIRYRVSPKFQINTGIIYTRGYDSSTQGLGYNSFAFYTEGEYRLNDRLSLSGMIMKEIDNFPGPRMDAFNRNTDMKSMSMGLNYRLTDNISFGANIRVTNGMPRYHSNPFYNSNPYNRNSFRSFSPFPQRFGYY